MAAPATKKHLKWYYAALLTFVCAMVYEPGRSENSSGDTISARYWPVAILKHGTWELSPFRNELHDVGYAALFSNDGSQLYPRNGWGMALFTVPFYAVADALGWGGDTWNPTRINAVSRMNSVAIATLSVALLFFILAEFVSVKIAFVSAAFFAFGTWNWSMGTQGLYSQTAAVLTHFVAIGLLWRICTAKPDANLKRDSALMAVLHVLIWSLRPQDILLAAPMALVLRDRKVLKPYLLTLAATFVPLVLAYKEMYGAYLGAYGVVEQIAGSSSFRLNGLAGFFGLLFSPNRGAIVFFPLLLWTPYLWIRFMPPLNYTTIRGAVFGASSAPLSPAAAAPTKSAKATKDKTQNLPESFSRTLGLGALAYFFTLCFVVYWHGTWAYGPRYLYDLLPYIWPLLTLVVVDVTRWFSGEKTALPKWALGFMLFGAVQSVAIHALGHYNYDLYVWNRFVVPVNDEKAWSFEHLMLEHVWNAGSNANRYPDALERLKKFGF